MGALKLPIYSLLNSNPISCNVMLLADKIATVESAKLATFKDVIGVPILIGKVEESKSMIYGGYITNTRGNTLDIKIHESSPYDVNKRSHKRMYTSFAADIRGGDKRVPCYVRDVSFSGMRLVSSIWGEVGDRIDFDLYAKDEMRSMSGIVRWYKYVPEIKMYEMGLALAYLSKPSYTYMEHIVDELEKQYYRMFEKIQV